MIGGALNINPATIIQSWVLHELLNKSYRFHQFFMSPSN
jgi:hypothetical protein